jgi:hypothetical protein
MGVPTRALQNLMDLDMKNIFERSHIEHPYRCFMVLQCNITSCFQKIKKTRIGEHLLECKVPQVSPPSNMSPFTPWTQWLEI